MPGSYSNPVQLDHYQDIVEVGWPSGPQPLWVFVELGGSVNPNQTTYHPYKSAPSPIDNGQTGGLITEWTETWTHNVNDPQVVTIDDENNWYYYDQAPLSSLTDFDFGGWTVPEQETFEYGDEEVWGPMRVYFDYSIFPTGGSGYCFADEMTGSQVPEVTAVYGFDFHEPQTCVARFKKATAPFIKGTFPSSGPGTSIYPPTGYAEAWSHYGNTINPPNGYDWNDFDDLHVVEVEAPATIQHLGKTYNHVASYIRPVNLTGGANSNWYIIHAFRRADAPPL